MAAIWEIAMDIDFEEFVSRHATDGPDWLKDLEFTISCDLMSLVGREPADESFSLVMTSDFLDHFAREPQTTPLNYLGMVSYTLKRAIGSIEVSTLFETMEQGASRDDLIFFLFWVLSDLAAGQEVKILARGSFANFFGFHRDGEFIQGSLCQAESGAWLLDAYPGSPAQMLIGDRLII